MLKAALLPWSLRETWLAAEERRWSVEWVVRVVSLLEVVWRRHHAYSTTLRQSIVRKTLTFRFSTPCCNIQL